MPNQNIGADGIWTVGLWYLEVTFKPTVPQLGAEVVV